MEIIRITQTNDELYKKAIALYSISFPLHEQREALSQERIMNQNGYHFDVICDSGQFVGEILYWDIGGFLYIEHFCVDPELRNRRYGQRILAEYSEIPLILEIDPPVDELSVRRKGFYERCGFVENPYKHVHPEYHAGNKGHELVVMSTQRVLTQAEYDRFKNYLETVVMKNAY